MPRLSRILWCCLASACAEPAPPAAEAAEPAGPHAKAERAARIAAEILAEPDAGSRVLDRHGITPGEFSDLMYEIAGDPELAEVYETVRG